jgi:hypothetical protein
MTEFPTVVLVKMIRLQNPWQLSCKTGTATIKEQENLVNGLLPKDPNVSPFQLFITMRMEI